MINLYLNLPSQNLQVFFAVIAFIEKHKGEYVFFYDNINESLMVECNKIIDFKLNKICIGKKYKTLDIIVDHIVPKTVIVNHFNGTLLFPKIIHEKFSKNFELKINKVFFRGLLTRERIKESLFFFLEINDFKAIRVFLFKLFLFKKEFEVKTTKVFFKFTLRGRQKRFKYLDFEYFEQMSKYKFIFCPPGDFTWTYRFYEAIQVNSLPLSKYVINEYLDFHFSKTPLYESQNIKNHVSKNYEIFKMKFCLE